MDDARGMEDELRLVSTDFDGTIHEEHAETPIPRVFEERIAALQGRGVRWVINTGREMQSLMETLGRSGATVRPDYLVLVEREIFANDRGHYVPVEPWNTRCHEDHARLFASMAELLPDLLAVLQGRHDAMFYDDPWSPLCAIARNVPQMDRIESELAAFARSVPGLSVVRNDVYVRLSHVAYSKGTALAELQRLIGVTPAQTLAAGDHFNDLPMLQPIHARHLVVPSNGMPQVKEQVARHGGILSGQRAGHAVAEALLRWL